MSNTPVDLRSDVVAQPTNGMRDAMRDAELGAYVDGDDPTVTKLERLGAQQLGKEAALFLPTTTMGNLIACLAYGKPGDQVLLDEDAHVYRHEVSGLSRLAGLLPRVLPRVGAAPDLDAVGRAVRYRESREAPIKLVWLENTHNVGGGAVVDPDTVRTLRAIIGQRDVAIHVDGARLFNAAVALSMQPSKLVADVDSVSLGFNKGLACPVGCLLVGSRKLIDSGIQLRRMLGGRQVKAGVAAAACLIALESMVERLEDDHAMARRLAAGLQDIHGLQLESPVVTNIVRLDTGGLGAAQQFADALASRGVLVGVVSPTVIRAVTHYQITPDLVDHAIEAFRSTASTLALAHGAPAS